MRLKKKTRRVLSGKYLAHKEQARDLVTSRLEFFNATYGFKWNRISIKNTKRRWGSCSKSGNLNFCYRLVFLSPEKADYIIVHELCHLGQFNHSKEFWSLVAKTIPDYVNVRRKLRAGGNAIDKPFVVFLNQ